MDTKFEFTTLYKNTREGRLSLIIPANHLHSVIQLITELVPRLLVLLKAHPARIIRSHVKWAHSQWHFVGILPNSDIRNDIARKTIPALFQPLPPDSAREKDNSADSYSFRLLSNKGNSDSWLSRDKGTNTIDALYKRLQEEMETRKGVCSTPESDPVCCQ